jgi:hypothetical protein
MGSMMMSGAMPGMSMNSDAGMTSVLGGGGDFGPGDAGLGEMQIVPDSDGNGTIDALPGCLVITQTQRIHRQITDLLDQLRQHASTDSGSAPYYPGTAVPGSPWQYGQPSTAPGSAPAATGTTLPGLPGTTIAPAGAFPPAPSNVPEIPGAPATGFPGVGAAPAAGSPVPTDPVSN